MNRSSAPRRLVLIAALILSTLFATVVATSADSASGLWRGDYETGDFSQWEMLQASSGDATIVTDPVRQGKYAARFEVRPGDNPIQSTGERAEVGNSTGEHAGDESWWAWSTYFPDDFHPNPNTHWNIFTDWHHTGTTGQANLHFEVDTTFTPWKIQVRSFGGQQDQNQRRFQIADFERNKWFDFVLHVRWAPDMTGFLEIWINGQKVLPKTYTPTIYEGQGVYVKQGFYRGPSNLTSVIYHDGMRRGTSYADVAGPAAPASSTTVPSAPPVSFVGPPKVLPSQRVAVPVRSKPHSRITVAIRGPHMELLGSARVHTNKRGFVRAWVRAFRWHRQRRLRIVLWAEHGQVARFVKISRHEFRVAHTRR